MPLSQNKLSLLTLLLCSTINVVHAETADRDKPMHLEADRVLLDDAKKVNRFEGNVQLTQGTLLIQADKIEVRDDSAGFQHLTATGHPVKFRQRYEGSTAYAEGYGNRIEYDTKADMIDFFEQARIKRGEDEVTGAHIAYSTQTEIFEVRGIANGNITSDPKNNRVRAVIQPKRSTANPATAAPLVIQPTPELPAGAGNHE